MPASECGMDAATAAHMARCLNGETGVDRVMYGLILPQACEMALRAPIDPLELALKVYNELRVETAGTILRYAVALERRNAGITERDRLTFLEKERARNATTRRVRARGTRSTRRHRKTKAGR